MIKMILILNKDKILSAYIYIRADVALFLIMIDRLVIGN